MNIPSKDIPISYFGYHFKVKMSDPENYFLRAQNKSERQVTQFGFYYYYVQFSTTFFPLRVKSYYWSSPFLFHDSKKMSKSGIDKDQLYMFL